ARETAPFTDDLYAAMHRRMPGLPLDIWELRRRQLGLFATTNIADFDRYRSRIKISPRQFLDELNKVTAAGLTA
ncbi:hypothetical protein, partial [Erythrobacter sp.]|uniref:hypothetical protein n=1 Tax=Erythrobacter sp. TaxID=1042 RepID=UPI00311D7B53